MADYDEDGVVIEQRPQLPAMAESRPQNLIFASNEVGELFGALCEMQGAMEAPKRTKKAKVKGRTRAGDAYEYEYSYAPLDEIVNSIKAPMATAGLIHRQFLAVRGGQHVMRTIIGHKTTGQWFGCDYPIFWDESRGMQGFASGVTYARRYGLMLALGIAAEDDDDANVADGNVATVQDRRQGTSRGAGRAEAPGSAPTTPRPTNGAVAPAQSDGDATSTDQSPTPSSTGETRDDAVRAHNVMKGYIDAAGTAGEVETFMNSQDWKDLGALLQRVDGEKGVNVFKKLTAHAEHQRDGLRRMEHGNAN